ncbi:MAG: ATP-binding protein [Bradymonadia bacterium]
MFERAGGVIDGVQLVSTDNTQSEKHRILVIDDNPSIHEDIRKILGMGQSSDPDLDALEAELFGTETQSAVSGLENLEIDSAYQGQEGLRMVKKAIAEGRPYMMAFTDVRMPPGWDGIETIGHIWKEDPYLQVVLCTAYSDYDWNDIISQVGERDNLLILKKPFDNIEVMQATLALTRKWTLHRDLLGQLSDLEEAVSDRTNQLQEANEALKQQMEERARVERELRLAQKLEAVGQLAAGIAHEINTPVQYIGDSVHFLRGAFEDLWEILAAWRALKPSVTQNAKSQDALEEIEELEEDADLSYLDEHVPQAFDRSLDGIERVATIVRAMKEFAHPDTREKAPADLNNALESALTVARNEYKYVAEVETRFGVVPQVMCHLGDLNQVFLNLIVNAAHAIEGKQKSAEQAHSGEMGRITLSTTHEGHEVVVAITDTGSGIPLEVQERIFDPFFTTKEVGKGTGQGLSLARTIVTEKHNGTLSFETTPGEGTTFYVRLPVGHGPAMGEMIG